MQHFNLKSILFGSKTALYISCFILLTGSACNVNKGDDDPTPKIVFTSISKDSIQVATTDEIRLSFRFSDGDGDLGNKASSGNYDIYTIDSRDTSKLNYFFPQGMQLYIDKTQGVTGECVINLEAKFMNLRPTRPNRDTVQYEVYIKDKAGRESNRFTTPKIYLLP